MNINWQQIIFFCTSIQLHKSGAFYYLLNGFEVRDEEVSVIVGHLVLQNRHQALQAHPCVDALLRQRLQLRLWLSKEGETGNNSYKLLIHWSVHFSQCKRTGFSYCVHLLKEDQTVLFSLRQSLNYIGYGKLFSFLSRYHFSPGSSVMAN